MLINNFVSIKIKVKRFTIPLVLPLIVIEEIADILTFIKMFVWSQSAREKLAKALSIIETFVGEFRYMGKLDMVDIEATDKVDGPVKIKISVW